MGHNTFLLRRRQFRLCYRPEEMKEVLYPGYFQSVKDPLINSYQKQSSSAALLSIDVSPNQRPNPRRISEWYIGEVQNQSARSVGPQLGLKSKNIGKGQWAQKAPNMDTVPRTGNFVNLQGLIRHAGNVNGE